MPFKSCSENGKPGITWGDHGSCYPYTPGDHSSMLSAHNQAAKQAQAAYASGYKGHSLEEELKELVVLMNENTSGYVFNPKIEVYDVGHHTLDAVEVFATGTHNNTSFTEADLDEIVSSFNSLDFKPPLKQGHMKDVKGLPALGYVTDLKRVGKKLVAKFSDIPTVVMDAIKRKSYNGVSIELYENLVRAGKKYGKAIKAVALLGADIPAVAGLAPLNSLFDEIEATVKIYDFETDKEDDMDEATKQKLADLEAKLQEADKKVKDYEAKLTTKTVESEQEYKQMKEDFAAAQATIRLLSQKDRNNTIETAVKKCTIPAFHPYLKGIYEFALDADQTLEFAVGEAKLKPVEVVNKLVEDINAKSAKLFSELATGTVDRKSGDELDKADAEVDRRAVEYQEKHQGTDYQAAVKAVLDADPDLKQAYAAIN